MILAKVSQAFSSLCHVGDFWSVINMILIYHCKMSLIFQMCKCLALEFNIKRGGYVQ